MTIEFDPQRRALIKRVLPGGFLLGAREANSLKPGDWDRDSQIGLGLHFLALTPTLMTTACGGQRLENPPRPSFHTEWYEDIEAIVAEISTLERKYTGRKNLPNPDNPQWRKDANDMLQLSYNLMAKVLPEQPDEDPFATTVLCFTQEEFREEIWKYSHGSQKVLNEFTNYSGGVTFEYQGPTYTLLYPFHPRSIPIYREAGFSDLTPLRTGAMHEWGHRINKQRELKPDEYLTLPLPDKTTITMKAIDGGRFVEYLPPILTPVKAVLERLNEALNEYEAQVLVAYETAGLSTPVVPPYESYITNLIDLIKVVGEEPGVLLPQLAAKRRAGDPFAIIEQLVSAVPAAQGLARKAQIIWGILVFEQSLAGRKDLRERLLKTPSEVEEIGLPPLKSPSFFLASDGSLKSG